jgi:zinc protease
MNRAPFLLTLCVLLLPASDALAKGRKQKEPEPPPAPAVPEKPPSMFQFASTTPFVGNLQVERWTLPTNGLSVLLVRDDSSDTIAYHTYFNAGSGDEVDGKTGLAHLFEHMMFKRTDRYDDQHFSRSIEEAGGPDLNAWTWLDMTAYHVSLPKDKLQLIVDLESTRMDGLLIDQGQLDAERDVVLNERRYRVDNDPEGKMNEELWSLAWEKTRYHWSTIGWAKDIEGFTVEDCTRFYKDFYAPNNATIVLVGNFETRAALDLIEAAYGPIPRSTLNRLEHGEEPEQTAARRKDMELPLETEMLQLGYKLPEITHADWAALAVVDSILTAGDSSRLQRRLVDSGIASSAGAFLPIFQHAALYEFSVSLRPNKAADLALAVVRAELEDLKKTPVSQEELDKARNQLLSHLYEELVGNSGRAGFLGFNEVAAGDWQKGLSRLDAIRAVTVADVQRVVQTWFDEKRSSAVVGRPEGKKLLAFKPKDVPKAKPGAELPPVGGRPNEGPPDMPPGQVVERQSAGWSRLMVYDPTLPMVWFRVVLPHGSAVEPAEKAGLANVTAELLLRGTRDRSRDVFERTLEGLGASLDAWVDSDSIQLSGSVLAENWPKVAELLAEALEFPRFDKTDFGELVEEIQAEIVEERNNDRGLGRKFFDEGLFPGHPYGRPVLGTTKSLEAITLEDVNAFYRTWFSSQGAVVALLGKFDQGANGDLAKVAGKLEAQTGEAVPAEVPAAPAGRQVWLVDKPGRTQVQIHLGHLFPRFDDPSYPAVWAANEAFGGYGFGTRLMHEVRELRGWSYGAYAAPIHLRDASSWNIWVFPASKDAIPCVQLVLELFQKLQAEGVSEDELRYARNSIVNSAAFYTDSPSKRLAYEVRKRLTGYDPLALVPKVGALTLADVNAAAQATFHSGEFFGTVVGTAKDPAGEPKEGEKVPTLQEGLQAIFGAEGVQVVPFDRE